MSWQVFADYELLTAKQSMRGDTYYMSDDFSITDNIVLQNAALDASLRKLSMRNAAMRNQNANPQQRSHQVIIALEKNPTPMALNGIVVGTAHLEHSIDNPNCSLRCGRELQFLKFSSIAERDDYISALNRKLKNRPGINSYCPCPECYPLLYTDWQTGSLHTTYQCICEGARYAGDIGLDEGFYMRRENNYFTTRLVFDPRIAVRFFHTAGHNCGKRRSTELVGPFEDASEGFRKLNMYKTVDHVHNVPCPACYGEKAFLEMGYSKIMYQMFLIEQKLDMA